MITDSRWPLRGGLMIQGYTHIPPTTIHPDNQSKRSAGKTRNQLEDG